MLNEKIGMKKVILGLLSLVFVLNTSGCPLTFFPAPEMTEEERQLNELRSTSLSLPLWCKCAVTPWLSWKGDSGILLHDYVSDSVISDSFEGNFRIIINESDWGIYFNDADGTCSDLLYLCDAEGVTETDNEFEADCTIKKNLYEQSSEDNKAHLVISKIDDTSYHLELKLKDKELIVSDASIINEVVVQRPSWLKKIIGKSDRTGRFLSDRNNQAESIVKRPNLPIFDLDSPETFKNFIYSYEGVTVKGQNDVNHVFSLYMNDRALGGCCDYLEIKLRDDKIDRYDTVDITFYKTVGNEDVVVKKYENLICYD